MSPIMFEREVHRLDFPFVLPPLENLAKATLPFPPLVERMALRTLRTLSAVSFLAFFWRGSFSILCIRARFAAFSRSAGASAGSNCKGRSPSTQDKEQQRTHLAFRALRLLLALQDLIKPAHAGGADTRGSECPIDLVLSLFPC